MIKIIPAVDILNNKCVRLYKGSFNHIKEYSDNPLKIIKNFINQGADRIHIVDLEGAKTGEVKILKLLEKIRKKFPDLVIEFGGGVRNKETFLKLRNIPVDRIICGTIVFNEEFVKDFLVNFRENIIISADVKEGKIAIKGWQELSEISISEFITKFKKYGFKEYLITDISRDGTLSGVDVEFYKEIGRYFPDIEILVSGGIRSIADIKKIKELKLPNIKGIIIGKSLYEGKINLKEAIEYACKEDNTVS